MEKARCPECGGPLLSGTCPSCKVFVEKKSELLPYFAIAGVGLAALILVAVLLLSPSQFTGSSDSLLVAPGSHGMAAPPSVPTCTIGLTGNKVPPSLIRLMVTSSTCSPGEVVELRVSINGAGKGTLDLRVSASDTFAGVAGVNNVIVTARYANGAEKIMYTNLAF